MTCFQHGFPKYIFGKIITIAQRKNTPPDHLKNNPEDKISLMKITTTV